MALTSSTGFRTYKHGSGENTSPVTITFRCANSATFKLGDAIRINTGGFAVRALTGEVVGGILVGLVDSQGTTPFSAFYVNNTGATITPDDTIATSATNQTRTDNYIVAQVTFDPAGTTLYWNIADGNLATTNLFQFFDATTNQITSGSAGDANGQFQLISLDPDGDGTATKGLFRINESQFSGGVDTATAKNAA